LAQPFVVTVRDANDNLVANYPVDWVVAEGNGKLTAYRSITGLNGQAQTILILGNQGPTNKVEVRAPWCARHCPIRSLLKWQMATAAVWRIIRWNL
jgi:hypothetical protein